MNRTFRTVALTGALTVALFLSVGGLVQAQDKPNILIIWGDDIGWFNVSAYNHGVMGYQTPWL